MIRLANEEWITEAQRRYGPRARNWRFRCPSCGHVQSGEDFIALGMTREEAAKRFAFSCIGRWMPECQDAFTGGPGPCNYAGGGLIRIAPICVVVEDKEVFCFDFADEPLAETHESAAAGGE